MYKFINSMNEVSRERYKKSLERIIKESSKRLNQNNTIKSELEYIKILETKK